MTSKPNFVGARASEKVYVHKGVLLGLSVHSSTKIKSCHNVRSTVQNILADVVQHVPSHALRRHNSHEYCNLLNCGRASSILEGRTLYFLSINRITGYYITQICNLAMINPLDGLISFYRVTRRFTTTCRGAVSDSHSRT